VDTSRSGVLNAMGSSFVSRGPERRSSSSCGIEVGEAVMNGSGRVGCDINMVTPLPLSILPLLVMVMPLQPAAYSCAGRCSCH
jgi:hypothetical protein